VTVFLVGAGPGDPGLLTRRGAALLARAGVVIYDRLVDPSLLALAPEGALLLDAGALHRPGGPSGLARQDAINALLLEHGRTGAVVVRLKGGDPFLFGRGGEEAEALGDAGIAFEVVPGVTSAIGALAYAGIPVTHRGVSTAVTFATGQVGDPTAPGGVDWESLGAAGGTVVVLMGMANREEIARRLIGGGRAALTPVAVVEWGTTPRQREVRTTLERLADVELASPSVIVIGEVADLGLVWPGARPLHGVTVVVTRPASQGGDLVRELELAGARVLEIPTVAITGPEDGGAALRGAAAEAGSYEWVAFTSANAVHRFCDELRDARSFGAARVAAVGHATSAALADHGIEADLVPQVSTAEGLAESIGPPPRPGAKILFPKAAAARPGLPQGLRALGWEVDEVVAYRSAAADPPPAAVAAELASAHVVTFTSPSTVEGFLALHDSAGRPLALPPLVACIGPVTADAARAAGLDVALTSPSPSGAALVAALADHLGPTREG
jgi:uroporphyrinogen III methyltransferase/synthase